jgi:hypothetical protein
VGPEDFRRWFRTIEFFELLNGWYFLSPEGLAVGPYVTERAAVDYARRLAKILKAVDDPSRARVTVIEFAIAGHGASI